MHHRLTTGSQKHCLPELANFPANCKSTRNIQPSSLPTAAVIGLHVSPMQAALQHPYVVTPSAGRVGSWVACGALASVVGCCFINPDGGDYNVWLPQVRMGMHAAARDGSEVLSQDLETEKQNHECCRLVAFTQTKTSLVVAFVSLWQLST